MKGKVYLVGAGPGDYKLLTLRGLECIKEADVIVYDRLINHRYLNEAKTGCEFIYVGKTADHHTLKQEEINEVLIQKAKQGKVITRLKGGDPYVFGRGGEEGEALKREGILFEVVPGITSAIGGLTYAGIPITHRDYASSFHVVTGHLREDKMLSDMNWEALAHVGGTLVFLMGVAHLKQICEQLIQAGMKPSTPVALIRYGTRPNQKVLVSTLTSAHEEAVIHGIKPPALIVVGEVVNMREQLNFFEERPLFGKNIIVTRSRTQNSALVQKISDLGGNPIEMPTIKIEKIHPNRALDEAIISLKDYTHLIFTSQNAVDIFFEKLHDACLDARALAHLKISVVGSQTNQALMKQGIIADLMPKTFSSEALLNELKPSLRQDDHVLICRPLNGSHQLQIQLSPICPVKEVYLYETVADMTEQDQIRDLFKTMPIDYVTFASSSSVRNFVTLIGENELDCLKRTQLISIGPMTSQTLKDYQLFNYKEAKKATIDEMVRCMVEGLSC